MGTRSYTEILSRLQNLKDAGEIRSIGTIRYDSLAYPIYCIATKEKPSARTVFLSAGIHGDEPAGVYALLEFFEKKTYSKYEFNFVALPCINPSGFELDTRENYARIDLNRNFNGSVPAQEVALLKQFLEKSAQHYIFAVDLHEDRTDKPVEGFSLSDNPHEFYLYEISSSESLRIGHAIVTSLESKGVPICKRKDIYEDNAQNGVITQPVLNVPDKEYVYFDQYLLNYASEVLTPETPTVWSLQERIFTLTQAVLIALDEFKKINYNP